MSFPRKTLSFALILLLALGTIRGGATSISKYISINDVPPIGYAMWQSLFASILLIGMAYSRTGRFPSVARHLPYYLVCGLIGTAIPNVIFFIAVRQVPAGTMAVLLTLVPIFTYLFVIVSRMESIDPLRLGGVLLGFSGALLIALPKISGGFDISWYVGLAVLCPLGYSIMSVFVGKRSLASEHPLLLAAGTQVIAFSFLLPAAIVSEQFHPIWHAPGRAELLILCHGVIAATAYTLFFKIVELAGSVFYSFSSYIIALTGIGWGMLIFGEQHGIGFIVAVALIFCGLMIVNSRQPQNN
jgi:drug/metabolite transporter (DMT)-like permease